MAFSNAQVTRMDRILMPCFARLISPPLPTSRPTHFCALEITLICAVKRGTNRRDIDSTRDSAGMIRPNRYTNLSLVITALKQENQAITVISRKAAQIPYRMDSSVSGLPLGR